MDNALEEKKKIESLLKLYPIRKVQIEDMCLQLSELELELNPLNAQQYEECVQTSRACNNNDSLLFKKQRLMSNIEYYKVMNKRAENLLNLLDKEIQQVVVHKLCMQGKSRTITAIEIDRSTKQVRNIYNNAINTMLERSKLKSKL